MNQSRVGLQARQCQEAGRKAMAKRQWAQAASKFEQAVRLSPTDAHHWLDLVELRLSTAEFPLAEAAARRLLALAPGHLISHKLLSQCLLNQGRWADLAEVCEKTPAELPRDMEFLEAHAAALVHSHRAQEALAVYIESLQLDPLNAWTHHRLGVALRLLKMDSQSAISLETACVLDPERRGGNSLTLTMLVNQLAQLANWPELARHKAALLQRLDAVVAGTSNDSEEILPFALLALETTPAQQLLVGQRYARKLTAGVKVLPPLSRSSGPRQRLRIGYLSADFYAHATVALMVAMLEQHDRDRFEVFLYCHSRTDNTTPQQRVRAAADHFRDINNVSDSEAARLMREDGIDIMIDLKGFTESSRMQILGARPAPLQISYLGYPGTTGADFLDYVIGDAVVTPLEHAAGYSERIAQLPHSYQPNDPQRALPDAATRAQYGLPEGAPVLVCFNQTYKITPEMADLWARILLARPEAVLWLLDWNELVQKNLSAEMAARGVAVQRLIFTPLVSTYENQARLQCADLFLDTWPCNAHTTASEALWTGVPVLTVPGATFASRVAASLVQACELPAFVCDSAEAYVSKAIALLAEPTELRAAQQHLRTKRLQLPLFDSPRYTRNFEALLLRMWQRHEAGLPPEHLPALESIPA